MYINDVFKFLAGPNPSRIKDLKLSNEIYTITSIEEDLGNSSEFVSGSKNTNANYLTNEGDLVISMFKERASVVSRTNSNKILTSNFCKCSYDNKIIDPWYFCYFINESDEFKKQVSADASRALSTGALQLIQITLPNIDNQKKIGKLYRLLCRREYLISREEMLFRKTILQTINNINK